MPSGLVDVVFSTFGVFAKNPKSERSRRDV